MDETKRVVLGFSMGFNSSASIVEASSNGECTVLAAISQERLNGEKNTKEIPIDAMVQCCRVAGIHAIDAVVYSHYQEFRKQELFLRTPEKYKKTLVEVIKRENKMGRAESANNLLFMLILHVLQDNGIFYYGVSQEIKRINHHLSHASAPLAIYGGAKDCVIITMDGFGDGESATYRYMKDGKCEVFCSDPTVDSIALIYQFVTGALGYKMHQHEGKLTGLAAYGKPIYEDMFYNSFLDEEKLLQLDDDEVLQAADSPIMDFDLFLRLKKTVFNFVNTLREEYGASKQDIACSLQKFAELVVLNRVEHFFLIVEKRFPTVRKETVFLSGGLFANVRINQLLREKALVDSEILVCPPMGDEGTAIGCAFAYLSRDISNLGFKRKTKEEVVSSIFAGTYMNNDVRLQEDLDVTKVAGMLADKKIVCLCTGKMEFGPRALCHRSILYDCSDVETNKWLNEQLGRTEFMPFAPVCLEEDAEDLFYGYNKNTEFTTQFMTMTLSCKEEMKKNYPAAVHIDGTARPQVIGKSQETSVIRKILKEYKRKTGKKVLINTSFNLHNYPIIESEKVAFASWRKSKTDVLVINGELFENGEMMGENV